MGDSVHQEHLAQIVTVLKLYHFHLRFSGLISIESLSMCKPMKKGRAAQTHRHVL